MAEDMILLTNERQIEDYADVINSFVEGKDNYNTAKKGEVFVTRIRNTKVKETKLNKSIKEVATMGGDGLFKNQSVSYNETEKEKFITSGFAIWEVIQPTTLHQYEGKWSRKTWIPQILYKGQWKNASTMECENWLSYPEEERRVLLSIGIIEETDN